MDLTVKQWALILACVGYTKRSIITGQGEQTGSDLFTLDEIKQLEDELENILAPYRKR